MPRPALAATEPWAKVPPGDRRARIVDATLTEVAERGYAGTTVAAIAATATVSLVDLERHFADREECFLAAYDLAAGWIEEWLRADLAGWEGGWVAAVRRALRTTADLLAADPRLGRVCGGEVLFAGPRALERHRAAVDRLAPSLAVGRQQRPADAEELPPDLERTLLGGAILSLGRATRPVELVPELTHFLLAPYLGVSEARRLAAEA